MDIVEYAARATAPYIGQAFSYADWIGMVRRMRKEVEDDPQMYPHTYRPPRVTAPPEPRVGGLIGEFLDAPPRERTSYKYPGGERLYSPSRSILEGMPDYGLGYRRHGMTGGYKLRYVRPIRPRIFGLKRKKFRRGYIKRRRT